MEDAEAATGDLIAAGGELIAEPREMPWRSLNSRLNGPAGLQLTLFRELDPQEEASKRPRPRAK